MASPLRCTEHPAFEADYCPSCGTSIVIGQVAPIVTDIQPGTPEWEESERALEIQRTAEYAAQAENEVSSAEIVAELKKITGEDAEVEMTGGGCATIFIGSTIAIGPGSYNGPDASTFYLDELYVGIGDTSTQARSVRQAALEAKRLLTSTALCPDCTGIGYVGPELRTECNRCRSAGRVAVTR